jgi:phosphatidylserine/phosphatidylglycerophosphate/cardiolipin synthase-like enzyme
MDTPRIHFLNVDAYIKALLASIPGAQKRVIIQSGDLRWGRHLSAFLPLLVDARHRGVEVRIIGDMYSKYLGTVPHPNRGESPAWKDVVKVNTSLREQDIPVIYIGKLGINPFKRRLHSKITIVDDRIFTFGGVNFSEGALRNRDYMLDMTDPILADRLYRLVRQIEKNQPGPLPDIEEQLGGEATLLYDGGTPKQSIIYETACRLVSTAKKVYYVSQMSPSGKLAKLITNTDNECYFIRFKQTDPPDNLGLWFDQTRYRIKNLYKGETYIHAKFILTEDQNGSKHVISGSHNFSWRGVAWGTKEIAVHATDEQLWHAFYTFLLTGIKQ